MLQALAPKLMPPAGPALQVQLSADRFSCTTGACAPALAAACAAESSRGHGAVSSCSESAWQGPCLLRTEPAAGHVTTFEAVSRSVMLLQFGPGTI